VNAPFFRTGMLIPAERSLAESVEVFESDMAKEGTRRNPNFARSNRM
jgi:hypothetical protein